MIRRLNRGSIAVWCNTAVTGDAVVHSTLILFYDPFHPLGK